MAVHAASKAAAVTGNRDRRADPAADVPAMVVARAFEKRAYELFLENLVKGTTHLATGQEAIAAGFAAAMRPDDWTFCTYRGHHHTLARGVPMTPILLELTGKADGLMGGKGGSMHLTSVEHGAMGSYAIIGAHLPIALGAAWSRAVPRQRPGGGVLLRRRHDQHRRLPRGAEPRRRLEGAGRVRVREQPLHGVHADRGGDRGGAPGRRSGRRVRPGALHRRRQRRRRGLRDGAQGHRPRPRRRGPGPDRGADLPPRRPLARRSGHVPAQGGDRGVAGPRPDPGVPRRLAGRQAWPKRSSTPSRPRPPRRSPRPRPRPAAPTTPIRRRSKCSSGATEARHGGTDLPRRGGGRDRPGDGARPERGVPRRGRRRCRRRLQDDRRAAREVRAGARARHPDQRAGHRRRRDGRGHDRPAADRRDHVLRLLRGLLGHGRQPDRQDPLHDQRPGLAAARDSDGERRGPGLRRPALPERRELGDGDSRSQGRGAVHARRRRGPARRGDPRPRSR